MKNIAVLATLPHFVNRAKKLADDLELPFTKIKGNYDYYLQLGEQGLQLVPNQRGAKPLYIDFLKGAIAHRYRYGGPRKTLLARAIGIQKKRTLSVLDVTAGLGRDAFILAYLGCKVLMLERSPIMAALLADGLARAKQVEWVRELSLALKVVDAKDYLMHMPAEDKPDVIYMDPMYPERKKSALVKKEMRILRDIVGEDYDAKALLLLARQQAKHRVVIKRARFAPTLSDQPPDLEVKGKSSRFDVYIQSN